MKILGYVNIFLEQCQIPKSDQMILLWRKCKIYLFSFPFSVCMSTQPTPIFPKMYRDWKGFQGYDDTRVHFYGGIEGPLSSKKSQGASACRSLTFHFLKTSSSLTVHFRFSSNSLPVHFWFTWAPCMRCHIIQLFKKIEFCKNCGHEYCIWTDIRKKVTSKDPLY